MQTTLFKAKDVELSATVLRDVVGPKINIVRLTLTAGEEVADVALHLAGGEDLIETLAGLRQDIDRAIDALAEEPVE